MSLRTHIFRLHRRVIDEEACGLGLSLLRLTLCPPAGAYGLAARLRGALCDRGTKKAGPAGVPVVSVGNITAGGTGKTPFVAWLARLLLIRRMRPAILSRGYGSRDEVNDENAMLARLVPDVPVVADPDRVAGAARARAEHGTDVLILDDGFQHRRIARDLDIVLIDALQPFGGGYMLPRGLLREPLCGLERAGFILITRANLVDAPRLNEVKRRLHEIAPKVPTASCGLRVSHLRGLADTEDSDASRLAEGAWGAFCGIGNPEGFLATLRAAGCDPAVFTPFADHERYSAAQLQDVMRSAAATGCRALVTTDKDAVKVEPMLGDRSPLPTYSAQTELDFIDGSDALTLAILDAVGHRG